VPVAIMIRLRAAKEAAADDAGAKTSGSGLRIVMSRSPEGEQVKMKSRTLVT
jgi:hypothetical protein